MICLPIEDTIKRFYFIFFTKISLLEFKSEMENTIYITAVFMVIVGFSLLWVPSLLFMRSTVIKENVFKEFTKRNIHKQLRDKCSDSEVRWVLYHLKETDYRPTMNRSEIETKILEVLSAQTSQWEFASDADRNNVSPIMKQICTQSYDRVVDELESNCTIQELQKIFDYITVDKKEQVNISKLDLVEDIVMIKRSKLELNVTHLVDKFCIERKLEALSMELMAGCSGGRIKKLFDKLVNKKGVYDVSCDQCVEKPEFVEAVVDVKRRYYHQVRLEPLVKELCIEPELKTLKKKLTVNCSGVNIKDILNELVDESSCDHCVEKAHFIDALINLKRLQFYEINVNPLILKYCPETSDD